MDGSGGGFFPGLEGRAVLLSEPWMAPGFNPDAGRSTLSACERWIAIFW